MDLVEEWESQIPVADAQGFQDVLAWLPEGWEAFLRDSGAFQRARRFQSPADLVRVLVASVALRLSLPALALWADRERIATLAFPSLWERLLRCRGFVAWALAQLVERRVGELPEGLIWAPLDATTFTLPGSKQRDWLVHLLWSQGSPVMGKVGESGGKDQGESLRHWEDLPPQAAAIGDRAYGTPPGLEAMERAWRRFLARFVWNNLPLYEEREEGKRVDPRSWLIGLAPGALRERTAWVRPQKGKPFSVRVVAVAKTAEAAENARRAARTLSKRKGHTPTDESLFLAGFVLLATNLASEQADAVQLAQAYRWRWQIEREFKRLKGTIQVRRLPNQKPATVEVYLLTLLLLWLPAHRIARESAFFPWGCPLARGRGAGAPEPRGPASGCVGSAPGHHPFLSASGPAPPLSSCQGSARPSPETQASSRPNPPDPALT